MDYLYDITVIVITYKPNLNKLISTLKSAVFQKNINMQIIVSDDGSDNNCQNEVKNFFNDHGFNEYKLIMNKNNVGTVNNIYNAIQYAKGKYTYLISPGDYFFSETTLSNIYKFSELNKVEIGFGQAQYYKKDDNVILYRQMNPRSPAIFNMRCLSQKTKTLAYCTTQDIVGACFFRKTDVFADYLNRIKSLSKYDEDNATTYIHLLQENKEIKYLNEFVVWYEFGTGISTSNNSKFSEQLEKDCEMVLNSITNNIKIIDYCHRKKRLEFKYAFFEIKSLMIRFLGKVFEFKGFLNSTNDFFDIITK